MMNLFGFLKKKKQIVGGETTSPTGSHPAVPLAGATGRHATLNPEAARVASLLDNPDLALQADEGVDPYNSGLFDRSESWARVNKRS
ncbi:MAG: hypothetical protein H0W33_03195 [Gammaproteobacteria bacterium]|nr:hypothetical protein [Gammaproteobacteria bacterium]